VNNQARQENGMDMNHLDRVRAAAYRAAIFIGTGGQGRERRDVPGWVLITLMTAALALLIWGLASERLQALFNETFDGFGFGN
jgi:hypothetical protein